MRNFDKLINETIKDIEDRDLDYYSDREYHDEMEQDNTDSSAWSPVFDKDGRVRRQDYLLINDNHPEKWGYIFEKQPNGFYIIKYVRGEDKWISYKEKRSGDIDYVDYDKILEFYGDDIKPMSRKEFEEWATIEML